MDRMFVWWPKPTMPKFGHASAPSLILVNFSWQLTNSPESKKQNKNWIIFFVAVYLFILVDRLKASFAN